MSCSKLPSAASGQSLIFSNGNTPKSPDTKEPDLEMSGQQSAGPDKSGISYIRPAHRHLVTPEAKASDYLVGSQLDETISSGEDVEVYWPFQEGEDIASWPQVEALW